MKTVVAFTNGGGGKLVFGVEDGTWDVKGFTKDEIFHKFVMLSRTGEGFLYFCALNAFDN